MPRLSVEEILNKPMVSVLPHIRRDPLVLSGLFLEITRQLYKEPSHVYPNTLTWNPVEDEPGENCGVFIDIAGKWDDENTNRRPGIFIDVGDLLYSTDKVQGFNSQAGFNLAEGVTYYNRLARGSVSWVHLGKTRGQALQYGSVTLDLVDGFSDVIRADFCFDKFDVRGILRPKQRKDRPKEWMCLVQADFEFQESFGIKRESPKLKAISFTKDTLSC
jgi:hypothetical protein